MSAALKVKYKFSEKRTIGNAKEAFTLVSA